MKDQNKKYLNIKKIKKQVKGITLIALVVTIIVLLILAGVALNLTIGQNGVFQRAQDAANTWRNAETNEQSALNDLSSWMDQYLNGNGGSVEDNQGAIKVSFKIEGEKVTTPPEPSGFTHVDGTEINSGYVIQDGDGNQFVWVPVDKNQKIKINVTSEAKIDSISLKDPYGDDITLADTDNLGTTYSNENIEPNINGTYMLTVTSGEETKTKELNVTSLYALRMWDLDMLTEEIAQAMGYENLDQLMQDMGMPAGTKVEDIKNMIYQEYKQGRVSNTDENKESVDENGGFYIARYEASYLDGKPASKASTSTRTSSSTTLTNGMLWNYISQTEALSKANSMYTNGGFTSSLPTGAAWDRTLAWLEETGAVTPLKILVDSKTWGNYADDTFSNTEELINTGNFDQTEKNNIYDLAGNLEEWTTESYSSALRVSRGGNYHSSGSQHPASNRHHFNPSVASDDIGFRVALYL